MVALLPAGGDRAEAAVEQALGLLLMTRFVRDRRPDALPPLAGPGDDTTHGVCDWLRLATASPLLKAVFDPAGLDEKAAVPASVWRAALAADLAWRDGAGRVVSLPATALGELHQLCLSDCDAGEPGRRRAGGVHYTPVSLADDLTGRVLDGVAAACGDGPLCILDPSCGGGTFLLAALRWLLGRRSLSPQGIKLAALWKGTNRADITAVELPASRLRAADWSFGSSSERSLLERLQTAGTPLGRLPVTMCQRLVTGADPVFLLRRVGSTADGEAFVQGRGRGPHLFLESAMLRPVVRNRDITGYGRLAPRTVCVVPHDGRGRLIPEETLRSHHPKTHRYLSGHRDALARRKGAEGWYALRSASCLTLPSRPRLMLKLVCSGGDFTIDPEGRYLGHTGVLMLVPDGRRVDPFYLLGVLNSQVFWFFVRQTVPTMGEGRHGLRRETLRRFPVVVSERTWDDRGRIADAVRTILAGPGAGCDKLLAEVERLVAGLYGVDLEELSPRQGGKHA